MANDPIVFVVDDEPAVLTSTTVLLEAAGFNVQSSASAEEFLASYAPGQSGCLLLDVRLPGMSGVELLLRLGVDDIRLPVILISGHANDEIRKEGMANGAVTVLEKPIGSQQLIEHVRNAIKGLITDSPLEKISRSNLKMCQVTAMPFQRA